MTLKPRKPWRVTVTGPNVDATADFPSEAKAHTSIRTALSDSNPANTAEIRHWEDGRWILYDRLTADELL